MVEGVNRQVVLAARLQAGGRRGLRGGIEEGLGHHPGPGWRGADDRGDAAEQHPQSGAERGRLSGVAFLPSSSLLNCSLRNGTTSRVGERREDQRKGGRQVEHPNRVTR